MKYLVDLSDFCVRSHGSVSDFRLKTEQSPIVLTQDPMDVTPKIRRRTVTLPMEVQKIHQIPYVTYPKLCVDSNDHLSDDPSLRTRKFCSEFAQHTNSHAQPFTCASKCFHKQFKDENLHLLPTVENVRRVFSSLCL